MTIDLASYITDANHFSWKEALWLNSINEFHQPSDEEVANIIELCQRLDKAREFIGKPFHVNCWIRPNKVSCTNPKYQGFDYNKLIGGASKSSHIAGQAVDFYVDSLTVDQVQDLLKPKLSEFQLAGEKNGSAVKRNWLHLQSRILPDGTYRFYNP